MLASLLPGLRDVRTPLAAGYLWLISLWLTLPSGDRADVEASTLYVRLSELVEFLGTAAALAGITFLAYVVGSMLTVSEKFAQSRRFNWLWMRLGLDDSGRPKRERLRDQWRSRLAGRNQHRFGVVFGGPGEGVSEQLSDYTKTRVDGPVWLLSRKGAIDILLSQLPRRLEPELRGSEEMSLPGSVVSRERLVGMLVEQQLLHESPQMALRLHIKYADIFDECDRHRAEAEFRLSIAVPLSVLLCIAALQVSAWLTPLVIIVPLLLLHLAYVKAMNATDVLLQALIDGHISAPVIDVVERALQQAQSQPNEKKG